jgi:hypothetical protein
MTEVTYDTATKQVSAVDAVLKSQPVRSDGPLKLTDKQLTHQYQQIVTVPRGGIWILGQQLALASDDNQGIAN